MSECIHDLFAKLTHGVYVVGVCAENKFNVFTASWVMQVSFNPMMLAIAINPNHRSYDLMKKGQSFTVNVLKDHQKEMALHCASSHADRLESLSWRKASLGAPILNEAMAWFECKIMNESIAGDHVIVAGKVIAGGILDDQAKPLIYAETGNMDESKSLYPNQFETL